MTMRDNVIEYVAQVAEGLPRGHGEDALDLALSDPMERKGLSRKALQAIGWLEGVADCQNMTVLELLDELGISYTYRPALPAGARRLRRGRG